MSDDDKKLFAPLSGAALSGRPRVLVATCLALCAGCVTKVYEGPCPDVEAHATSSSSTSSSSSSTAADLPTPRLDVAAETTGELGCDPTADPACRCNAVDVLFVFDVSGSMCREHDLLSEAFPSFVDAMFEALPGDIDLHVGMTKSAFEATEDFHFDDAATCASVDEESWLHSHYIPPTEGTIEGNGRQGRLFKHDGRRYFPANTSRQADREALATWASGAARRIGCDAHFEFPAAGAAWALHPANTVNEGFVRDAGAALVLFLVSDSDHSYLVDDEEALRDIVLSSKKNCGEQCIVTSGLINTGCDPFVNDSLKFIESFGHGEPVYGSINDTSRYDDVVGQTLAEAVARRCLEIIPEG